ncbi:hypothetical protein [Hymenobacter sp. BRD67]|uniref:hypothetical protein n=1 Tax=Hymenobacter sp. BRD67 TaxID=2675877 RepID=UPI0015672182|nr:hypothetical protein [Hymenobacter sp. BRD67]QKG53489.1 hypothetical protein GKZ67_13895 [Hymenobacter sp. BRD67]
MGFLLLSGLGAQAQEVVPAESSAATVSQQAQRQAEFLADALQLKGRQVHAVQAALLARLDANDVLSHLLFVSGTAAAAAYEAVDYRYYAVVGKVLTPSQFHLLLQLDEKAAASDAALATSNP